jgi:hypothetical protein
MEAPKVGASLEAAFPVSDPHECAILATPVWPSFGMAHVRSSLEILHNVVEITP